MSRGVPAPGDEPGAPMRGLRPSGTAPHRAPTWAFVAAAPVPGAHHVGVGGPVRNDDSAATSAPFSVG